MNSIIETGTVSSCLTFDLESGKLGIELHIRTLTESRVGNNTAVFIMVVSPAVLAHDVSVRAGDVSMGIAVFPVCRIYSKPFEKF